MCELWLRKLSGVSGECDQGCSNLHWTCQEEDRHCHGCSVRPQEARPYPVRFRRLIFLLYYHPPTNPAPFGATKLYKERLLWKLEKNHILFTSTAKAEMQQFFPCWKVRKTWFVTPATLRIFVTNRFYSVVERRITIHKFWVKSFGIHHANGWIRPF